MGTIWERNAKGIVDIPVALIYGLNTVLVSAVTCLQSLYSLIPTADDMVTLGTSAFRWKEVHTPRINPGSGEVTTIGHDTTPGLLTLHGNVIVTGTMYRSPLYGWANLTAAQTVLGSTGSFGFVNILYDQSSMPSGFTVASGIITNNTGRTCIVQFNQQIFMNQDPTAGSLSYVYQEVQGDSKSYGRTSFTKCPGGGVATSSGIFILVNTAQWKTWVYTDRPNTNIWGVSNANTGTITTFAVL